MPYVSAGTSGVNDPVRSIVQVIVTLLFLVLLNMGITCILNNPVFRLLGWFNHISLFWKLMLLFLPINAKLPINQLTTKTTVIMNNFKI